MNRRFSISYDEDDYEGRVDMMGKNITIKNRKNYVLRAHNINNVTISNVQCVTITETTNVNKITLIDCNSSSIMNCNNIKSVQCINSRLDMNDSFKISNIHVKGGYINIISCEDVINLNMDDCIVSYINQCNSISNISCISIKTLTVSEINNVINLSILSCTIKDVSKVLPSDLLYH
jgi:hypothetical protein